MSSQVPPDPILTTYQYWNWENVDEETRRQRALDNTYMRFPTVQNKPTTFSKLFVPTDIYSLVKIANTTYVGLVINSLLTAVNTWTGPNTMTIVSASVTQPIGMDYSPTFSSTQRGYVINIPITTGPINGSVVATISIPTPGVWWIYISLNNSVGYSTGTIIQVYDGATLLAQSFQNIIGGLYSTLKVSTTLSFDTGTKSITFVPGAGGGGIFYNGGNCFAVRMG